MSKQPALLDLFCGRGGWSKAFMRRGWWCVGVDIVDLQYPGVFMRCSVFDLTTNFINSFDGVVASPPCQEFARAWLPWLRGDKTPNQAALTMLRWSVELCLNRRNRIAENSLFASHHMGGGKKFGSYSLWGDVPLKMPTLPRTKMKHSGMRPDLRAEITPILADSIAEHFTKSILC